MTKNEFNRVAFLDYDHISLAPYMPSYFPMSWEASILVKMFLVE